METWKPISEAEILRILEEEAADLGPELASDFERYRVTPYLAPLERYGNLESVYVVARKDDEVMYYEDVEEGFNISPVSRSGTILEHWCNQDTLRFALIAWAANKKRHSDASGAGA